MAARVGTVLSDEHILRECSHYRPIPMKLASKIIDGSSIRNDKSPFSSKPLKYQRQLARPEHFDSYAHSLNRNLGNNPEFRGKLHAAYTADVAQHHNENNHLPESGNVAVDDPHLLMYLMSGLFSEPTVSAPPQANTYDFGQDPEPAAPPQVNTYDFGQDPEPAAPPQVNTYDFGQDPEPPGSLLQGNTYDFGQDPNSDDDLESIPELSDDEDLPPLEEIPHAPKANKPGPSNYAGYDDVEKYLPPPHSERPAKAVKKGEPSEPLSGMKLRSGKQLQGSQVKAMKTQGEYTTDPFNINVNVDDIATQKKRMAAFASEQSSRHRTKSQGKYTTDPFNTSVNVDDIATNRTRKALFTYEQQRLASQKRQQSEGPNNAYFL
jgi:hypothetical protein